MISEQDLQERFRQAMNLRSQREPLLDEISRHFAPTNRHYDLQQNAGRNYRGRLYDNNAARAVANARDSAIQRLLPKGSQWASIVIAEQVKDQIPQAQQHQWELALAHFSRQLRAGLENSNFRKAMTAAAREFIVYGYATCLPRVARGGMEVAVLPSNMVWLEDSPNSNVTGVFWRKIYTVRGWNIENPMLKFDGDDSERVNMIFYSLPTMRGGEWGVFREDTGKRIYYFELAPGERSVIVGKMDEAAGCTYPSGLGEANLTEAQTLNKFRETHLRALAMWVNPIWIANRHAIDSEGLVAQPGARILVDSDMSSGRTPIQPLQVGGDPNVSFAAMNDMVQNIRSSLNIMPRPSDTPPNRTATEWLIERDLTATLTTGFVDIFRDEVILPTIEQWIRVSSRVFGTFPKDLVVDGTVFEIHVAGDDERRRKTEELQRKHAALDLIMRAMQVAPEEALVQTNIGAILRGGIKDLDLVDVLNSDEQVNAMLQAMEQQQQQAQQGQQTLQ